MIVVNMYADSYLQNTLEKSLNLAESDNKYKYLNSCLQQRSHFSLFVVSVDGILVTE